jgi:Na+/H+ antiporter NhaD/arsenite permease-like protein
VSPPALAVADPARTALIIFALTYAVLGFGALPPLRIDRTGATLVGATCMVGLGVLTPHEAMAAVDFHTLALLFGMMIVVAHLRLAGFFRFLGVRALRWAHAPRALLVLVVWLSGVLSALFVNDTACLMLTPLVLEIALALGLEAVPFLLAVAMGSNAGSVATLVGNPQNMIVASFSHISYARFSSTLAPVAIAALALTSLVLAVAFRRSLRARPALESAPLETATLDRPLLVKSLLVTGALLVALLAGVTPSLAALGAASALLITRRVRPAEVYAQVDWSLLAMFAGLFVVVAGVERSGLSAGWLHALGPAGRESIPAFVGVTAVLSNLVSNVPAALLLKGWAAQFASPERAWLALAMASTLAGNLTLVGSVANLIVVEQARGRPGESGPGVSFWAYARVGVPLTLATLALGTLWLMAIPTRP